MDDQAFRRERLLASGLLRWPLPVEPALVQRMGDAAALPAPRAEAPGSPLSPRPRYQPGKRPVSVQ